MSQNIFEYLNITNSDTPRLTSEFSSEQNINSFLEILIEINGEHETSVFIVEPFVCFIELAVMSDNVNFWVGGEEQFPSIKNLSEDSRFKNFEWMKYYQSQKRVFELPLSELYKIIQHLLRVNKLKSFL